MREWKINMADTLQAKVKGSKNVRENLTTWDAKTDAKAPLSNKQKDSFSELTTRSSNRPLPVELPLDDFPSVAPRVVQSRATDDDIFSKEFSRLAQAKVENSQQFFLWFSDVEDQIEQDADDSQREYLEKLVQHRQDCEKVIEEVEQTLTYLLELKGRYVTVSTKTNALHEACENLLEDQTRLVETADSINDKLAYFNELDRISSKLGVPTLTVTNESFVPMLSRLDECIDYLNKNPQYKESQVYLAKFKQCLSRALNLIKLYVVNILQNATQQVLPKKEVQSPNDDAFTMFYGKFRTNAPRVKALMEQVENRLEKSPEYEQLLTDCHQAFFQQRQTLLGPSVSSAVADLASKHARDHCALVRSGCAFMVHVCEDENQLFFHFFSKPTQLLAIMLEGLCQNLYDVLRPFIIHINHLETLAELCSILKIEMIEEHVRNNPEQLAAFEIVCKQMLEDVQERLVYRTHIYIRQEILAYNPAGGDLAYPEKLELMESIAATMKKKRHSRQTSSSSAVSATSLEVERINLSGENHSADHMTDSTTTIDEEDEDGDTFVSVPLTETVGNMPMSPADLHGMWYPTVRRTLVCLSKLFRCIDKTTFQGLSQETLSLCIFSLENACDAIIKKKTVIDGQLFLIKHLLILREQIAPFNVDFSLKEMSLDFSKIKDAAYGLLSAKSKLFAMSSNNALLQFLLEGTPQMTEMFIDSKKEVDRQLKKTCEDFIHHITAELIGPLNTFLSKADVILGMEQDEGASGVNLRQQPFAEPDKLHDVVAETYKNLKNKKLGVQRSMALYLANKDTEYILFRPVKTNIQQCFQKLHQILQDHYCIEDQQIVGAPSLEQINLLLTSVPEKPDRST